MACFSPLKGYVSRSTGGLTFRKGESLGTPMEVACGQCLGCRLDRSRMWSMRIVHEAALHESDHGSSFVTLTYRSVQECDVEQRLREFHIPDDWSLHLDHFQKFMKRLRKRYAQSIRFFHVGEYGSVCRHGVDIESCPAGCGVGRPHYHAILFNVGFDDLEKVGQNGDIVYYTSPTLESIWKYGFVQVGEVNMQTAGYVGRYCLKKVNGVNADEHYVNVDERGEVITVAPEYATMSRRPGIGSEWFAKYGSDVFPRDEVPVPGKGVYKKVPRYYDDLYGAIDVEKLERVKLERQKFRKENAAEYSPDRLMAKYKVQKRQVEFLKREI